MQVANPAVAAILDRLDRVQWRFGHWMASCPVPGHGKGMGDRNRSLSIREGDNDSALLKCFNGCSVPEIMASIGMPMSALFDPSTKGRPDPETLRKLAERQARGQESREQENERRKHAAIRIFERALPVSDGDFVDRYLRGRGLVPPDGRSWWPSDLRIATLSHPKGGTWPAMVAAIRDVHGHVVACHRTYLDTNGDRHDGRKGKAPVEPSKMTLGPLKGCAIRIGYDLEAKALVIAEGVESAIAAAQTTERVPWSAISAGGLEAIELPPYVRFVTIAYDKDKTGIKASRKLAQRLQRSGLQVELLSPPLGQDDHADAG